MQKIRIIYVGKSKREEQPLESEYAKRIKRYADLELTELKDERASESLSAAEEIQVMKKEGERILAAIRPDERVIALAIEGKQPDTIALSKKIRSSALSSQKLCFVIGGSLGLSPEVKARSDELMSLSLLTLPHRLARIVLLEQIYRSLTIINNKTYHK